MKLGRAPATDFVQDIRRMSEEERTPAATAVKDRKLWVGGAYTSTRLTSLTLRNP